MKAKHVIELIEKFQESNKKTEDEKELIIDGLHASLKNLENNNDIPDDILIEFYEKTLYYLQGKEKFILNEERNSLNNLYLDILKNVVFYLNENSQYSGIYTYNKLFKIEDYCLNTLMLGLIEEIEVDDLFFADYDQLCATNYILSIEELCFVWKEAPFTNPKSGKLFTISEIQRLLQYPPVIAWVGELQTQIQTQINNRTHPLSQRTVKLLESTAKQLKKAKTQEEANSIRSSFQNAIKLSAQELEFMKNRILIIEDKKENSLQVLNLLELVNKLKDSNTFGTACYHKIGGDLYKFTQDLSNKSFSRSSLTLLSKINNEFHELSPELEKPTPSKLIAKEGQLNTNRRHSKNPQISLNLFSPTIEKGPTQQTVVEQKEEKTQTTTQPVDHDLLNQVNELMHGLTEDDLAFLAELEQEQNTPGF